MKCTKERTTFSLPIKEKVNLKIRLHREGITQAMFFNAVVTAYNELDEDFMLWYTKAREQLINNKARRKTLRKEENTAIDNVKKFGFNKGEIDDIYDLIAEEKGEQM